MEVGRIQILLPEASRDFGVPCHVEFNCLTGGGFVAHHLQVVVGCYVSIFAQIDIESH